MRLTSRQPHPGFQTDRARKTFPWRTILIAITVLALATIFAVLAMRGVGQVTLDLDDLETGTLQNGVFVPEITVNGMIVSDSTVSVSAIEGGAVERLEVQNGAEVEAGSPVVQLSNPALLRQVSDEAVRLTRDIVAIEGQITDLERQIVEAERVVRDAQFQLRQAEADLSRNLILEESGFASPAQMERLRDEVAYYQGEARAAVARLETAQATARSRITRLVSIREDLDALSAASLQRLDNLILRAPLDGQVAGLQVRSGEVIQPGAEVFRISRGTADQITARIFESLAQQIEPGASARLIDYEARLRVDVIEPEAVDGTVSMRMVFLDPPPTALRSGQIVPLAVQTGAPRETLMAPYGELVGPEFVWVVNEARDHARAVPVRLGQRSRDQVEILSEIEPGTLILLSSPRPLDNLSAIRLQGGDRHP